MQELIADAEAAAVTLAVLSKEMSRFIIFNGIELAICARELVECALKLFNREEIPILSIFNNPRSFEVNRAILGLLGDSYLPVIRSAELTRTIIQALWDGMEQSLLDLRERGVRPATVWSPAL
jgi:hypothetical protein